MKSTFVPFLLVIGIATTAGQDKADRRPGGANASFTVHEFKGSNSHTLRYSLFVPMPAESDKSQKPPLVLCLHGAGGGTAAANLLAAPEMQKKHPCVVMAPACDIKGNRWVESTFRAGKNRAITPELIESLDAVVKEQNVDRTRVYLTGQSMGGVGTWGLIAKHADRLAAAVPVCGIWPPEDAAKMNGVAIWAFHGDKDLTVAVAGSRDMIAALRKAGVVPEAKYSELAGVGHGSWGRAYATPELWDWLFAQRRKTAENSN